LYQNLNTICNILYSQHLIYGLYVCTYVFLLRQEYFDMIMINNRVFMMGVLHSQRLGLMRGHQNVISYHCHRGGESPLMSPRAGGR
jgi:hypothetical protein